MNIFDDEKKLLICENAEKISNCYLIINNSLPDEHYSLLNLSISVVYMSLFMEDFKKSIKINDCNEIKSEHKIRVDEIKKEIQDNRRIIANILENHSINEHLLLADIEDILNKKG